MPDEAAAARKKKRPKGIVEPPLGFGRDIELAVFDPRNGQLRAAFLTAGTGVCFVMFGLSGRDDRLAIVGLCGAALLAFTVYLLALWARHRTRDDWHLRLTHREIDVPRVALFGPLRVTCALHRLGPVAIMHQRNGGRWIEAQPFEGPRLVIHQAWLDKDVSLGELYWRLAARHQIAWASKGEAPRSAFVGAEAGIGLSTAGGPIVSIVLSRATSKRPIIVATVNTVEEYFERLAEWPEDAKLIAASDVRERFLEALDDATRLPST